MKPEKQSKSESDKRRIAHDTTRFIASSFMEDKIFVSQKFQINLRFISEHKIVGPENIIESPEVLASLSLISRRTPDAGCKSVSV